MTMENTKESGSCIVMTLTLLNTDEEMTAAKRH